MAATDIGDCCSGTMLFGGTCCKASGGTCTTDPECCSGVCRMNGLCQ
jgi:hypothetical protein